MTLYGEMNIYNGRYITAYINKIRKKIQLDQERTNYILKSWGVGYKFNGEI